MKGGRCFNCYSVIETDNEDCLCNNCLSETKRPKITIGRIIAILIIVILFFLIIST